MLVLWEGLRVISKGVDQVAHWLEGCSCHEATWMQKGGYRKRKRDFEDETGRPACPWKGCRLSELASYGCERLFCKISSSGSALLSELMLAAPLDSQSSVSQVLRSLRTSLLEALTEKFAYVQSLPYKCAGMFIDELFPGDRALAIAKQCANECCAEYDGARQAGQSHQIHRVAVTLLDPSLPLRSEVDRFRADVGARLQAFAPLFRELQELAKVPMSTRKVEQPHALVKRFTAGARNALPAATCAELRHRETAPLLDPTFPGHTFVVLGWRGLNIRRDLLAFLGLGGSPKLTQRQLLAKV